MTHAIRSKIRFNLHVNIRKYRQREIVIKVHSIIIYFKIFFCNIYEDKREIDRYGGRAKQKLAEALIKIKC